MSDTVRPESGSPLGVDRARKLFTRLVRMAEEGHSTLLHLEREGYRALLAPLSQLDADAVARLRRVSLTAARPKLGALVKEAAGGAPCVLERKGTGPVALLVAEPAQRLAPQDPAARAVPIGEVLRLAPEPGGDVMFGLPSLDTAVRGLTAGRHVVLAAAPGAGGSLLAAAAARTTALDYDRPVLYAASGLRRDVVADRMVAGHLALNYQSLRARALPAAQQQAADAYASRLYAPLYIDDAELSADIIADSASRIGELALVVVDRLQYAEREGVALSGAGLPAAARILSALAHRLRVPVLTVVDSDDPQVLASLHADIALTLTREGSRAEVALWERDFGALAPVRLGTDLACARFIEAPAAEGIAHRPAGTAAPVAQLPASRQALAAECEQPRDGVPRPTATAPPAAMPKTPARQEAALPEAPPLSMPAPDAQRRPGAWPKGTGGPPAAPAASTAAALSAATLVVPVNSEGVSEDEQPESAERPSRKRRFDYGPFAVLDGEGFAYLAGGRSQACKATTVLEVAEWALARPFGTPRARPHSFDRDPLIVLMPRAAEQLGLPPFPDPGTRALPADHPLLAQIDAAGWKVTRRGEDPWFSTWPRVYQPMTDQGERRSVQFAILSWGALSKDGWPLPFDDDTGTFPLPAGDVVAFLDAYSRTAITPASSTGATSHELMKQTRPRTRPWNYAKAGQKPDVRPAWVKGALHAAVDPAPCEVPPGHPLAKGRDDRDPAQVLNEEALNWWRKPTQAERRFPYVVTVDVSAAFGAAANRLRVGLCAPYHLPQTPFDKDLPGSWLADLSHVETPKGMPSPFTPDGTTPTGPAWYETRTIAYATELGFEPGLMEAQVRPSAQQAAALGIEPHPPTLVAPDDNGVSKYPPAPPFGNGLYLTPWYEQLRDALLATYARMDVTPKHKDEDPALYAERFLAAMARLQDDEFRDRHATDLRVLKAVKDTFKSGIGKLRERDHRTGARSRDSHAPWPALKRPEWRPDIRAAVIARSRVNLHRKIAATMEATGAVPLAIRTDSVTYASATDDVLGLTGHKGGFTLGPNPGHVKPEPAHTMDWYQHWADQGVNPAGKIKHLDKDGDE
ncbi:DnaB-like helicase C-terminal domain-containing protein [Streptomyces sp. NBC_00690]|uniref:DnaB-like helicase C-terminal domain-containing protein n=1 Tax=Streptomyces sp. NBC_00690 TaxID=2975808 RepID=UPI002E294F40|nr:DnaB-like helicase C-terminal domain-containing protein [Streptomyces sp. NBC_00690]